MVFFATGIFLYATGIFPVTGIFSCEQIIIVVYSFSVEKFGTERMINLKKDELYERIVQFKNLTQFDLNN